MSKGASAGTKSFLYNHNTIDIFWPGLIVVSHSVYKNRQLSSFSRFSGTPPSYQIKIDVLQVYQHSTFTSGGAEAIQNVTNPMVVRNDSTLRDTFYGICRQTYKKEPMP